MICSIDLPEAGAVCERMSARVRGWIIAPPGTSSALSSVELRIRGRTVATTSTLLHRPDVAAARGLPHDARTGFEFYVDLPEEPGAEVTLEVWAALADSPAHLAGSRLVRLSRQDYSGAHFGSLLSPGKAELLHRHHIYNPGPPSSEPSAECVSMLLERISAPPGGRVLDVGCGVGAYAGPMRAAGFSWIGVETSREACAVLTRAGLPHHEIDGHHLPFADRSFDTALCIEVLEHVADPDTLLGEIVRVAGEALISVPNCELIPYYSRQLAIPWHLLESTHLNFFSRWSLQAMLQRHFRSVEITAYGPAPVRSVEGGQLYYHLLAHVRA